MACANKAAGDQGATDDHGAEATEEGKDEEFRLILVGKSGVGKSATGNTILGKTVFTSTLAANATTTVVQKEQGNWNDKLISVIDTPALFDSKEVEKSELKNCLQMCQSGRHVFLLVIQVGRFTAEDMAAAKCVRKIFGDESISRTILLFTCKEDLGGDPLEKYLKEATNKNLHKLLKSCHHRVCGFNNKAKEDERKKQVSELMEIVEALLHPTSSEKSKIKPWFDQTWRKKNKH